MLVNKMVILLLSALAMLLSSTGAFSDNRQDDDFDWVALTLDNDLFVGKDNGYTNGFYLTFLDVSDGSEYLPTSDFWVAPLLWSLPNKEIEGAANIYSLGQTLLSPSDITIEVPPETELPYSALLAVSNTYLTANQHFADRVSTTLGIVGPWALGKPTQKYVHEVVGADDPKGWDTQLDNELVFQFLRSRGWRNVELCDGGADIITAAEVSAGTLSSSVEVSTKLRFGSELIRSFPTTLLSSSRISNPIATNQGWFFYLGLSAGYIFNQIFADGNTFRNSRSIDYDPEYLGVSAGVSVASENWAFTFAFADSNLIENSQGDEALENLTRYGTMTFAWRL